MIIRYYGIAVNFLRGGNCIVAMRECFQERPTGVFRDIWE